MKTQVAKSIVFVLISFNLVSGCKSREFNDDENTDGAESQSVSNSPKFQIRWWVKTENLIPYYDGTIPNGVTASFCEKDQFRQGAWKDIYQTAVKVLEKGDALEKVKCSFFVDGRNPFTLNLPIKPTGFLIKPIVNGKATDYTCGWAQSPEFNEWIMNVTDKNKNPMILCNQYQFKK